MERRLAEAADLVTVALDPLLPQGEARGKADDVTLLGAGAARQRVELLSSQCKAHLDIFGEDAKYLRESVDFVLNWRV